MPENNNIKGKIILRGQIECLTPIHVGSGRDENSDLDILRNAEGKPFIPATSLVGILRHIFLYKIFNRKPDQNFKEFWGYTENDDGQQSAVCCSNLTLVNGIDGDVINRDGISIDNRKGLVKDKGKFDFELLERGARFNLDMEFTYYPQNESYVKRTVSTIYDLLASGKIYIGAKTNAGFGKVILANSSEVYLFDFFHNRKNVRNWLLQNYTQENLIPVTQLGQSFFTKTDCFSIIAEFKLKSSLIVRSYGDKTALSDSIQLKSVDDWVIPGTSLKGAIRVRAERIVNTLALKNRHQIIYNLFGFIDKDFKQNGNQQDFQIPDEFKNKKGKKGKLRVHEVYLKQNNFPAELQTRIKVDRFTGGVIESALFESMPIFAPEQSKNISIQIDIDNYEPSEAGLILLVLKDLWNGDLAIGGEKNIGRGVFEGVEAKIKWDDKQIILQKDVDKLSENEKTTLQGFVDALVGENAR